MLCKNNVIFLFIGRAGRTKPGKCYRLYTESDFDKLAVNSVPEMQRFLFSIERLCSFSEILY